MLEDQLRERAENAEAQLATAKEAYIPVIEKIKNFKTNFGVREKSNGEIDIDFDKFVDNLGLKAACELRAIIDEHYQISGTTGEKPHIRLQA